MTSTKNALQTARFTTQGTMRWKEAIAVPVQLAIVTCSALVSWLQGDIRCTMHKPRCRQLHLLHHGPDPAPRCCSAPGPALAIC